MSLVRCNFIESYDGTVTIDVKTIATGGAGVITFPSDSKTFLRGDNTFTSTLATTSADPPLTLTMDASADLLRMADLGDAASNRAYAFAHAAGFGLGFVLRDDAFSTSTAVWVARRTGMNPTVFHLMPEMGRTVVGGGGTYPDDAVNTFQVAGTISATLGLNMPATSRQIITPNQTYDLYGASVAASYYVNGNITVSGAGQQNELISLRPGSVTLSGANAAASPFSSINNVVSSIAGTIGYGASHSVLNAGAGQSVAMSARASGVGAGTGTLIGSQSSVTTVAGTEVVETTAGLFTWTGPTRVPFGIRLKADVANDPVNYAIAVDQSAKVDAAHILLQRGPGAAATAAHFLQCQDITSGTDLLKIASTGTLTTLGDLIAGAAGKGLQIKEGSNARMGTATLVAGTVTVANTSVTANTRIFFTITTTGGTQGFWTTTRVAATSFTVTSTQATETSTFAWFLVEPAA
jgi:hypothetical protein